MARALVGLGLGLLGTGGCLHPPAAPAPAASSPASTPPASTPPASTPPASNLQSLPPVTDVPAPVSVEGRLGLALVSSWLWIDGAQVAPLDRLDFVVLLERLRTRRASTA